MAKKPSAVAPPPEGETPDVERHDEVYFRHQSAAKVGRVLARGVHGCVIEADGQRHKVKWENFLGHKTRVRPDAKVVDEGEDGLLVEHPDGRRRFVRDPMGIVPPGDEKPLAKSLMPIILIEGTREDLLKAIKGRPGLSLQDRTDKSGRRTKRWVKTTKDEPKGRDRAAKEDAPRSQFGRHNLAHGDRVNFKAGDFEGHGTISGEPGDHGSHVKDSSGRTHQVLHSEITHHVPKDSKRAAGGGAGGGGKDGDGAGGGSGGDGGGDDFDPVAFTKQFDDDGLTEETLMAGFDEATQEKVKDAAARLEKVIATRDKYRQNDNYTAERQAVHREIFARLLSPEAIKGATPAEGEQPKLILLGGRGGSGKSNLDGMVFDKKKAIVIDPDDIKKQLPEYQGWNAAEVHEESSDISKDLINFARLQGLNVVIDATMGDPKSSLSRIEEFRKDGYGVEAHYMHLPRPLAAKRAIKRFVDAGDDGRFVPPHILVGNTGNEAAFDQVRRHVDRWTFHDNQGEKGTTPKLIAQGGGKKST